MLLVRTALRSILKMTDYGRLSGGVQNEIATIYRPKRLLQPRRMRMLPI